MTTWTRELDEAIVLATKKGCWHIVLFYLLCGLAAIPTSFLVFSQVFTNATPEHWCAPPPELEALGLPEDQLRTLTVPPGDQNGTYDSCMAYTIDPRALYVALHEYVDERTEVAWEGGAQRQVKIRQLKPVTGELERKEQIVRVKEVILSVRGPPIPCQHGWRYSTEHYRKTLVTEYNLVCDRDTWPRTGIFLFWVSSIFGNLFFGWLSDKYGRRPTILLMVYIEVPVTIAASFSSSYWCYLALRVVGGLFFPALYQQPFILTLELMPPHQRPFTGIVESTLFASGMCLLALLAYCLRDWFTLSLATSLPFILLYSYYWLIPESPRWLVGRGRIAEAEKVLRDIARRNGIDLPYGFLLDLHKKAQEDEDAEVEISMLSNGHLPLASDTDESSFMDRRLSNMISFKPELKKITETDNRSADIERIIAHEVAEIVNKKSRVKEAEDSADDEKEIDNYDESHFTEHSQQKSTQTDPYTKPSNNLRRKSIQLVSRIFILESSSSMSEIDNKRLDDQNSNGDCKASLLDLFRYPLIRKKFFLLTFNWVALGVVYNGMSYNTPNLGVDDYIAFFIGGAVEIPSYFIGWKCMDKLGRRWVMSSFMTTGGLACLSCAFVPQNQPWVTVGLAMLGRLLAAASFAVLYVWFGELVPTVLRAQAMGLASFIGGIGLLACPEMVYLAVYARALPLIVMGVLALLTGIASLFLPETLNQPLPQTIGDGEAYGKKIRS